jgi:hypothetical protein
MSYTTNECSPHYTPQQLDSRSVHTDVSLRSNDSHKTSTISNEGEILCQ